MMVKYIKLKNIDEAFNYQGEKNKPPWAALVIIKLKYDWEVRKWEEEVYIEQYLMIYTIFKWGGSHWLD